MRNILATLAIAVVPALMVSACSGNASGPGASAVPNLPLSAANRLIGPNDTKSDLEAGGATFPAYGYNLGVQPVGSGLHGSRPGPGAGSLFAKYGGATIYYCLTGSGFGRAEFEANNGTATKGCAALGANPVGFGARRDPLDFVGSDVAMASTECCASGTTYYTGRIAVKPSYGEPFEFPSIGGPIVYPYVQSNFSLKKTIKLSTWTYCAIANGTVGNWNDDAITKDNGGSVTGGAAQPITFYYRSDKSGTSYLFTNHLAGACNRTFPPPYNKAPYESKGRSAAWTFGANQQWPGPTGKQGSGSDFIGASGNPGVLAGIQSTAFATGYAEGAWAAAASGPKVAQSLLQDTQFGKTFVDPTDKTAVAAALAKVLSKNITYGGGSDGNSLQSKTPWCQLYLDPSLWQLPPKGAYPIVGVSYLLFYGENQGVHVTDKAKLVKFIVSGKADAIVKGLEYAPTSKSVHQAVLTALKGKGAHTACLK
jgi:ABC-type phosphate transport system substrate-binding protein